MPLDITEYDRLAIDGMGRQVLVGQEPSRAVQSLTITASSGQSAALSDITRFVRLHTDAPCRVAFGPNPTATAGSQRLAAGVSEYFGVRPGDKIAVIAST